MSGRKCGVSRSSSTASWCLLEGSTEEACPVGGDRVSETAGLVGKSISPRTNTQTSPSERDSVVCQTNMIHFNMIVVH